MKYNTERMKQVLNKSQETLFRPQTGNILTIVHDESEQRCWHESSMTDGDTLLNPIKPTMLKVDKIYSISPNQLSGYTDHRIGAVCTDLLNTLNFTKQTINTESDPDRFHPRITLYPDDFDEWWIVLSADDGRRCFHWVAPISVIEAK